MNEMTSVATNGSWVTMIMKISAGSSGARRAQAPARASAVVRGVAGGLPAGGSATALMPSCLVGASTVTCGWRSPLGGSLLTCWYRSADLFGELLALVQRLVDASSGRRSPS